MIDILFLLFEKIGWCMMHINDFKIGMSAEVEKQATLENNNIIAEVSGDYNPIHFEDDEAKKVGFKGIIAHALFAEGLISNVLGMKLPGQGAIIISKTLKCIRPVYMGDNVTAYAEIADVDCQRSRIKMYVKCTNQLGELLIEGSVLMCIR